MGEKSEEEKRMSAINMRTRKKNNLNKLLTEFSTCSVRGFSLDSRASGFWAGLVSG